jgi:hypothetical protein
MRDEEAVSVPAKDHDEAVEELTRPEPDVAVLANVDRRLEEVHVRPAQQAMGAVGAEEEIAIHEIGRIRDGRPEADGDAEVEAAPVEDLEERQSRDARKAVSVNRVLFSAMHHVHVVPGLTFLCDPPVGLLVVLSEERQRAVGEDDAPAERVGWPVALDDGDLVRGIALLEQRGEVEPAGSTSQDVDLHSRVLTTA